MFLKPQRIVPVLPLVLIAVVLPLSPTGDSVLLSQMPTGMAALPQRMRYASSESFLFCLPV